jgi:hypothetical protein
MADRNSAAIFGEVFKACAAEGEAGKRIAAKLWPMCNEFDFTDDQMDADEALLALGLARPVADRDEDVITMLR